MPQISGITRSSDSLAARLGYRLRTLRVRGLLSLLVLLAVSALSSHPASGQTSYIITNSSGAGGANRCLIFGNSNQQVNPSRYLWTSSNPEYCGFGSEEELLQNKQAVWKLAPIGENSYIITHSSPDKGVSQCLIFGGNNTDTFPSRYMWGAGQNQFCGFSTKKELVDNGQAVWKLIDLGGNRQYAIMHSSKDGRRDECLIFGGNGNDTYPSRYLWGPGGQFCGFNSKEQLLNNKQAVWTIKTTDTGPNCKYKPFAYDNGPAGQPSWCGECNFDLKIPNPLQAPINITKAERQSNLPEITFNYKSTSLKFLANAQNVKVDGDGGGSITIGTLGVFNLKEFHFHRPSEEAVDNHRSAMVIHLVHEKNGTKEAAVISILVEAASEPNAPPNDLIAALIKNFPPPAGAPQVFINASNLLPTNTNQYYTFAGSLTTPPCTEGITFYVLKTPITLPASQIEEFARRYPLPNARDIQNTNGRKILERAP